jgi:hypothetical protein
MKVVLLQAGGTEDALDTIKLAVENGYILW